MHETRLLHRWLTTACPFIHLARVGAVVKSVGGLLAGGKLSLTHIGRSLRTGAFAKHNIKCIDRLLGNASLHAERMDIYRAIAQWVLRNNVCPVVIVDWSDCEPGHEHLMLKAAVPVGGRALTVYEEVHPLSRYNAPGTHRRFLEHLRAVLPPGCTPIIVTDAGFRGPWFRQVEDYGWHWVGRVRNRVRYCLDGTETWRWTTGLYPRATSKPSHLGRGRLSRRRPYDCGLYLVRKYHRGPGRPKRRRAQRQRARWRRHYREPWLLATSLPHARGAAREVVRLYSLRMQIEETFRDAKSHRWGFGLRYARSRSTTRLEVLLLINTLATLVYWLAGLVARARGWQKHFQANTERREPVLSVFFLGKELLRSHRFNVTTAELVSAARTIPLHVHQQAFGT
jgi:hypothetical protein